MLQACARREASGLKLNKSLIVEVSVLLSAEHLALQLFLRQGREE